MKGFLKKTDRFLFRTHEGRALLGVFVLCFFTLGYVVTVGQQRVVAQAQAQSWPVEYGDLETDTLEQFVQYGSQFVCPFVAPTVGECAFIGSTSVAALGIHAAFVLTLSETIQRLERYIAEWLVDGMMVAFLETLDNAELNLIDWWDTFWFYNLYPALQDFTEQISVSLADQVRIMQATSDSLSGDVARRARTKAELEDQRALTPSPSVAVTATLVGGLMKSKETGRYFRAATQNESFAAGSAAIGSPGAAGLSAGQQVRNSRYENLFCDPGSNGGRNTCDGDVDPRHYNLDIQVSRQLFNRLTIDVQQE